MSGLDVVRILGLGVMGFGFLLAFLAYRLLGKIQLRPNPNSSVVRSIYFFMGFSIVLCGIGLASQLFDQRRSLEQSEKERNELQKKYDALRQGREDLALVSGKIEVPVRGHTVPNRFDCAGTLEGYKSGGGVHIWLAVEINGFIWPKERQLRVGKDGRWSAIVFEDGGGTEFSLILLAADEVAHAKIEEWLALGKSRGKYERMNMIEGSFRLDRVEKLRLEDKP